MAVSRLKDSQKKEILEGYRMGKSTAILAEEYGCSPNTVSRTVKALLPSSEYTALKAARIRGDLSLVTDKEDEALSDSIEREVFSESNINLKDESLEILCRLLELRTVTGLNVAVSMRIFLVSLVTAVSAPPFTPASATGFTASAITKSSEVNLIGVAPSPRGKNSSPSLARRTMMRPPSSLSKSKTCVGCPSSKSTKLVASTTAFLGTSPRFAIFVASHSGDSETWIP